MLEAEKMGVQIRDEDDKYKGSERMYASNLNELARVIESLSLAELGIAYMEVAKSRKTNVKQLLFSRNDLTENDEIGKVHFLIVCKSRSFSCKFNSIINLILSYPQVRDS